MANVLLLNSCTCPSLYFLYVQGARQGRTRLCRGHGTTPVGGGWVCPRPEVSSGRKGQASRLEP